MTTRRYLESDIKHFADNPRYGVWSFRLSDKFGDSGTIAVLIMENQKDGLRIDTFLMSCRVLGRKVEDSIFVFMQHQCAKHEKKTLLAEFIPTEKNAPAKNFYQNRKFSLIKEQDGAQFLDYKVSKPDAYPPEMKVEFKIS